MSIFQEILETRSFTVIEYTIENALPTATGAEKEALTRMLNTKVLDEIYAIAYEQLGEHEKAAELRQWIANKEKQPKQRPELLLAD